jgi:hypothetical protein
MYAKIRQLFIALLFVFCLLASSVPVMAQDANVPDGPVVSPSGQVLNTNEANAPIATEMAAPDLAADQGFQNKLAFVNSLTTEQRTAFVDILAKHQSEIEAIAKDLQDALNEAASNQLFLPGIIGGSGQASAAALSSAAPATPRAGAPDQRISESMAKVASIQSTITQELAALLTAEQQPLFEKVGFAQVPQQVSASTLQGGDGTQSSTDCYYAAVYASYSAYYAWYAEYYAYYDYYYYGNTYAYYDWYYNYYAKSNAYTGALYAGGAYALSFTQSPGNWNDTAFDYFSYNNYGAQYYSYWGRYYAYYSNYYYGSSYAYYAYIYADYAYYYEYYAWYYSYYCS